MTKKPDRKRSTRRTSDTPVVAEARRARRTLAREFGADLGRYLADVRRREAQGSGRPGPRGSKG